MVISIRARPGLEEERRVWVLVDLDVRYSRCRYAWAIGFDSIYDQGDPIRSRRIGIQETGERGDVVLIENGQAIQSAAIERVAILILTDLGADLT